MKRGILSLLLAACIMVHSIPMTAFAVGTETELEAGKEDTEVWAAAQDEAHADLKEGEVCDESSVLALESVQVIKQ